MHTSRIEKQLKESHLYNKASFFIKKSQDKKLENSFAFFKSNKAHDGLQELKISHLHKIVFDFQLRSTSFINKEFPTIVGGMFIHPSIEI